MYGSIPHKLVEEVLKIYHLSHMIKDVIMGYYNNLKIRIGSESVSLSGIRWRGKLITGYTMTATLFALVMNMIIKSVEKDCRGQVIKSRVKQLPIRAHMDDMIITAPSIIERDGY